MSTSECDIMQSKQCDTTQSGSAQCDIMYSAQRDIMHSAQRDIMKSTQCDIEIIPHDVKHKIIWNYIILGVGCLCFSSPLCACNIQMLVYNNKLHGD